MENGLSEVGVTRTILEGFFNDFMEYAQSDVIIVGGGPSGTVAATMLAREGVKTLIIEKDIKAGGGMWQGGMLMPKIVVEEPAASFLQNNLGVKLAKHNGWFVADSYYVATKLMSTAFESGAKMFNSVQLQDVIYRENGVRGVVINWQQVAHLTAECVDPLALEAKVVIDATGHNASVCRVVNEKIGLKEKFVGHEGSMWVEKGEEATVNNTREVYPGLIVAGMAANSVTGMPRMGPIFGGMFLSGVKAAHLALKKINGGKFKNNLVQPQVLEAINYV